MDKNKSRTDLLAAGRKKLQQFRQNKDGKGGGSQGKSSKKSSKSEQLESDVGATSAATKPTTSLLPEGKIVSRVDSDPGALDTNLAENSVVSGTDVVAVDSPSMGNVPEVNIVEISLAHDAELLPQQLGVVDVDFSVSDIEESTKNIDAEEARAMPSASVRISVLEGETKHADNSIIADVSTPSELEDTTEGETLTAAMDGVDRKERQESLFSQEVFPDTSLIQVRGEQVTDIGPVQEADDLGLKQFGDRSSEVELEGDGKVSGGSAATLEEATSGRTEVYQTIHEAKPTSKFDYVTESIGAASTSDGSSFPVLDSHEANGISAVSNQVTNQLKDVLADLPNDDNPEMHSTGFGNKMVQAAKENMISVVYNQQYMPEGSFMTAGNVPERSIAKEMESYSTGDGCSVSLPQLKEVVGKLSEDDFRSLLNFTESVSSAKFGTDTLILTEYGHPDSFERLKEELYLTNFRKDIFHLQLTEMSAQQIEFDHHHQKLVDERSVLHASLDEAQERRECLAEELAHCNSELQAVASRREELESQVHSVKTEAQEFSCRARELQINLERSEGNLSSLSKELADSKGLVASLQVENENLNGTLASIVEDKSKLVEEKESLLHENETLTLESADCKSLLATLQVETSNLSGALSLVTEERKKLEEEKDFLGQENGKISTELTDLKDLAAALRVEIADLNKSLSLTTEERKKLEEEKESLACVNEKMSVEMAECKGVMASLQAEVAYLNGNLALITRERKKLEEEKEFFVQEIERLSNEILLSQEKFSSKNGEHRQDGGISYPMSEKTSSDGPSREPPLDMLKLEAFDNSFLLGVLKGNLEEAEKILQNLEKTVERMHSESISFKRSDGKVTSSGVSKLIQSFESKVHHDANETEEEAVTEDRLPEDLFMLTKEQTGRLRAVLQQLHLDAENVKEECRKFHDVPFRELNVEYEALKEHSDNLEATNVELGILYEVVKQHASGLEAKNNELQVLYEALKQQDLCLKAEYGELGEKVYEYQSRVSELLTQLHDLQRSSDENLLREYQLESLQKEATERTLILEQEWNSTIAQIIETVGRLDESIGRVSTSAISISTDDGFNVKSHISASVNASIKMIKDLQEKLEASLADHEMICSSYKEVNEKLNDLLRKNESASSLLFKIYDDLRKLLIHSCGAVDDEPGMNIEVGSLSDPIDYIKYKTILEQLEHLLGERLQLQSLNNELNSELMQRINDVEKLNRSCLDSNAIKKLIEDVEGVLKLEKTETYLDEMPASHLELLVSLLVQKYKEASEQVSVSGEEFGSKVMELTEMQEKMHELNALRLKHENEILAMKESLSQAEEALTVARSELQEKISELDQSDQRVSSVREKLSIAVAKGKGLVVQRDALKQSLSETSEELERCSQELDLKDARLHELETKLKTYMEAGERMEALESELSYIRNSATALRESFLLKDSVLHRIEEILEDLDLPENFHSRGIIEKVDWLARSATGSSLPVTDWDHKSSVGGSYSDVGFVVTDAWKEDAPLTSSSGDDIRRKYEELQGKFYGLAEQNEMLEQSLMERNHVVQRWEELLDRINIPSHLRSMEPEERIEWLGTALVEAGRESTSLHQKIDNLENYCATVTADLEESQKRISDLEADLLAVMQERDRFSEELQKRISDLEADLQTVLQERDRLAEKLEILTSDHEKLSAKAVRFELENRELQSEMRISVLEADLQAVTQERDRLTKKLEILTSDHEKLSANSVQFELENRELQSEMTAMQVKLAEKEGNEARIRGIEGDIHRLEDLVSDVLSDAGAKDLVSGENTTECLELLLRKLIERYSNLSPLRPVLGGPADEHHTEEIDANLDESGNRDMRIPEQPDVTGLKKDLEEALSNLMHVKEERDLYLERQQSMVSDVESLDRKREELQELLIQEEQKSASLREKLNIAVRKGKSLVQQRDSLKQTVEEMNNELERLKSEISRRENALMEYEQKIRHLSTYPEMVEALETEKLFLRNRFTEMEQLLKEREHILDVTMNVLGDINVGSELTISDPVEKVEHIGKLFRDLHSALAASEQESRKSRRAAELLLAELNEVQERNDTLQEELAKIATELTETSKERDVAEAAKLETLSQLEKLSTVHSEGKQKQYSELMVLKVGVNELKKSFYEVNSLLVNFLSKDLEFVQNLEAVVESCLRNGDASGLAGMPILSGYGDYTSSYSEIKDNLLSAESWLGPKVPDHLDDGAMLEVWSSVGLVLQELKTVLGALEEKLLKHPMLLHDKASNLSRVMEILHGEMTSQKNLFEALKKDIKHMELIEKEKHLEIVELRRNVALLYEACANSIMEIEKRKAELVENNLVVRDQGMRLNPSRFIDGKLLSGGQTYYASEECVKAIAEGLSSSLKEFSVMKTEIIDGNLEEMKATVANLQRELQEKDIQKERICAELVSQIKEAEATARSYLLDTQSSQNRIHDMEQQMKMVEEERSFLELKVKELLEEQATSMELQDRVRSLSDVLAAKDQEIEALMQALDEEEIQMEALKSKLEGLEKVVQQKNLDLENLEASRGKISKRLSITVNKFDELHHLSESLLAEVEKLQSQLQDRDSEISYLRQEVTRCTNEVLVASQMSNKRDFGEIQEFLSWVDTMISRLGVHGVHLDDKEGIQVHEYKEILKKKISAIISEFDELRAVAQSRDTLLQVEKSKVQELTHREEILQKSLLEKEYQINMLEGEEDSGQARSLSSEILEVEPLINKWAAPGPSTTPQVRSLRKVNNDQVAIAIDNEPGSTDSRLEDEDEDKVHGFKSLTTSRIVPRFTRPLTDMIDGLWVSCDRALMRQPALRLGIMLYWVVLQALLASFVF